MRIIVELPAMEIRKAIKLMNGEKIGIYFDLNHEIVTFSVDNFFFRYGVLFHKEKEYESFGFYILSDEMVSVIKEVRSKTTMFEIEVNNSDGNDKHLNVTFRCNYKDRNYSIEKVCNKISYSPKEVEANRNIVLSNQFAQFICMCKDCKMNKYVPVTLHGELVKKDDVVTFSIIGLSESYYYLKRFDENYSGLENGVYEFNLDAIKDLYNFISAYVMKEPFTIEFQPNRLIISYMQMSYQVALNKSNHHKGVTSLFKRNIVGNFAEVPSENTISNCPGISFISRRSKFLPATIKESDRYYYSREDDKKSKSLLQVIWMKSREK